MRYFDAAFVTKFYLTEEASERVRAEVVKSNNCATSALSLVEVKAAFHRQLREGQVTMERLESLCHLFDQDVVEDRWRIIPLTEQTLRRAGDRLSILPSNVFLRAGDAIHLISALEARSDEIWTNDRRLLAAAPHFGLLGRTI